jgi:NAD(P)-dependent dehydrogenase (short-subunit alcohol dehydrogenase family)
MGEAAAKFFLARGWAVYAGARRVDRMIQLERLGAHVQALDVTKTQSNRAFVKAAMTKEGRIDVLVNNAGYGEYGPVEDIPMAQVRAQFDVNFFGAVQLTQMVLPIMRAQRAGRIVHISSIGGDLYTPLGAFYHATKAALQQFSDALDAEVRRFGVRSVIVQPGGTQSEWAEVALANSLRNTAANSAYRQLVDTIARLMPRMAGSTTSQDLAKVFYRAATDPRPKRRYLNSVGDRLIVWAARSLPGVYRRGMNAVLTRSAKPAPSPRPKTTLSPAN